MPIAPDHVLAAVLVVLFPARSALFGYRRLSRAEPGDVPRVRMWLYRQGIAIQWTLAAATVALWAWQARPWSALGVVPRPTWGLAGVAVGFAVIVGFVLAQRARALEDDEALERLRHQMRNVERMMPRTDAEMRWFNRLAVTAGVCEELLYRGYLLWYLGHWLAVIPAVAVASVVFGVGHAYQGARGVLVTTLVGLFMCGVYLLTGSLIACVVIHALMDLHAGHMARAAFAREREAPAPANGTIVALLAALLVAAPAWAAPAWAAPPDEPVVTTAHAITLDGRPLRYTAEAGRIVLPDSAGAAPRGAIFYVAYRVAAAGAARPVTFVWNGGPGANALRLHLEGLGPRRVEGEAIVDNEATLLDVTDLVFMDPVGTGFSRAAAPEHEPRFYSTLGDFAATAEFVSAWRARHDARRAPLYLAGESFGTWRAAAAAEALGARGEHVAGVILISGGCPVGPIQPAAVRSALRVPGWMATALHHGLVVPDAGGDREAMLEAARGWAIERYAPALERVASLSAAERDTIARELARRIGIARARIADSTLTVTPRGYRESLLPGDTLNTFDMRIKGATPRLPAAPIGRYLRGTLGYETGLAYRELEPDSAAAGARSVNRRWSYDSAPVTSADMARAIAGEGPPGAQPWMLRAIARNPDLRVFVASGWYDSFGGCWGNQDLVARLPADVASRFTVRCYASGHMIGSDDQARPRLARDLRAFIAGRN